MSDERFLMPRNYGPEHEAAMIAITARLRPIAESPTTRLVEVTYWRDGADMPLTKVVFDTHTVSRWRREAPIDATHLTIEERPWPTRPPWRFDVPAVPDHVMAMTGPGDGGPRVWVRGQRRRWAEWPLTDEPDEWISFVEVIYRTGYGGLVECPDPRAAS